MPIVTVKSKYQIVIPATIRKEAKIRVGDILAAKIENGSIVFTPKALIDRGIAKSLADYSSGRAYGPFDNAEQMLKSIQRNLRQGKVRKTPRRKP